MRIPFCFVILTLAAFSALPAFARTADSILDPVTSKEERNVSDKLETMMADALARLQAHPGFSIREERILLHQPKRGFPQLTLLITEYTQPMGEPDVRPIMAGTAPLTKAEVEIIDYTIEARSVEHTCFRLLKDLAPTRKAMDVERVAGRLCKRLADTPAKNVKELLAQARAIRGFFDRLKNLPKLTPEEIAEEDRERAVLAPEEYNLDHLGLPEADRDGDRNLNAQFIWHGKWNHDGYILAFSECTEAEDFEMYQFVVSEGGGIFQWSHPHNGSNGFYHRCYESRLEPAEFEELKKYLFTLPASQKRSLSNRYIASFHRDGMWTTLLYDDLPKDNPFEKLIHRMVRQDNSEIPEGSRHERYLRREAISLPGSLAQ